MEKYAQIKLQTTKMEFPVIILTSVNGSLVTKEPLTLLDRPGTSNQMTL